MISESHPSNVHNDVLVDDQSHFIIAHKQMAPSPVRAYLQTLANKPF